MAREGELPLQKFYGTTLFSLGKGAWIEFTQIFTAFDFITSKYTTATILIPPITPALQQTIGCIRLIVRMTVNGSRVPVFPAISIPWSEFKPDTKAISSEFRSFSPPPFSRLTPGLRPSLLGLSPLTHKLRLRAKPPRLPSLFASPVRHTNRSIAVPRRTRDIGVDPLGPWNSYHA